MNDAERRVARLEKKFQQANDALRRFEEENSEVLDELRKRATLREAVLQELETAVRETRLTAAGMQVSVVARRDFDGKYLWDEFANDPELRDRFVKVEYKVVAREFDSLQRRGLIKASIVEKAVVDVKDEVRLLNRPKSFILG